MESSNPKDIEFLCDLTKDAYTHYILDNSFIIFNSVDNILCLLYITEENNIIVYNINDQQKIGEIKHYNHKNFISCFKHFLDKANKRDLIMTVSSEDNNITVWDLSNLCSITNIEKVNNTGVIFSACFLRDNDNCYILTSNCNQSMYAMNFEPIKLYDLKGNKIKEVNESNEKTFFIETYYDNSISKMFIITCNFNYIKSYDYDSNDLYHKYFDNTEGAHYSFAIYNSQDKLNIIESTNRNIRIWNFHTAELLDKFNFSDILNLYNICIWNQDYIFLGCNNEIKLVDLKTKKEIKNLKGHLSSVLTIKKINHPKYGEVLISKGFKLDPIKLWTIKEKK